MKIAKFQVYTYDDVCTSLSYVCKIINIFLSSLANIFSQNQREVYKR